MEDFMKTGLFPERYVIEIQLARLSWDLHTRTWDGIGEVGIDELYNKRAG